MNRPLAVLAPLAGFALLLAQLAPAAPPPPQAEIRAALLKSVHFYHKQVSRHGGYVWACSGDLRLREGEGVVDENTIWVQPPGTPAVGEAFLDAYEATKEQACLDAARDAAHALVNGQLHSGGWHYRIDLDPHERREWSYRVDGPAPARKSSTPSGWEDWKKRKHQGDLTVLDDDTTQAATRYLVRYDKVTGSRDTKVHEAAAYALQSLIGAQYPNGAWSASYDRYPAAPPSARDYPVTEARYPDDWPRAWPKDFTGCYVTNDNLIADAIDTMLLAAEVYGIPYLDSARRAGDFLILAQMPDPQPAWA